MEIFNDKDGQKWNIEITVGSAMKVRAECDGINLVEALGTDKDDRNALDRISEDPYLLVSVLYSLCESQAKERGVSPQGFASLFTADTLQAGADALLRELINFSQPAKRKMLKLVYERVSLARGNAEKELQRTIEDPETAAELDRQLSGLFGSSRES